MNTAGMQVQKNENSHGQYSSSVINRQRTGLFFFSKKRGGGWGGGGGRQRRESEGGTAEGGTVGDRSNASSFQFSKTNILMAPLLRRATRFTAFLPTSKKKKKKKKKKTNILLPVKSPSARLCPCNSKQVEKAWRFLAWRRRREGGG